MSQQSRTAAPRRDFSFALGGSFTATVVMMLIAGALWTVVRGIEWTPGVTAAVLIPAGLYLVLAWVSRDSL